MSDGAAREVPDTDERLPGLVGRWLRELGETVVAAADLILAETRLAKIAARRALLWGGLSFVLALFVLGCAGMALLLALATVTGSLTTAVALLAAIAVLACTAAALLTWRAVRAMSFARTRAHFAVLMTRSRADEEAGSG